ncbi:hypothetical protein Tco_0153300 [Tanacetum coccineum]
MVEPEVPLKKKDQVALDEKMTRNLEAQLKAELIEEERLIRQKEEEAKIALIESWDNTQAMMEADFELAQRATVKNRRKNLWRKIKIKLFDKEMKRLNTFVDMNLEVVKGSETRTKESSKRAGDELESDMSKRQKIDEHVKVEKDHQEEAEMKRHIEIVKDDEGINREDLETPWKLVKAKHENTRPEEDYERVLWGNLKVMFERDIKSEIQKMNIKFRGELWGLKDYKMILRVTTAQLQLLEGLMLSEMRSKTYHRRDKGVFEEQEIKFEKVVEEPIVEIPVGIDSCSNFDLRSNNTKTNVLFTTAATTVTSVRPRAKGIIFHDQEEQGISNREVIQMNGPRIQSPTRLLMGQIKVLPLRTAEEEILARERERKARTTLLMALPEDSS